MNFIRFLNENVGALSTLLSGVVMLATVVYAILTASLVRETRKMREIQTEPRIEVIPISMEEAVNIFYLRVKNIGLGPAYNVRFRFLEVADNLGEKLLIDDFTKSKFFDTGFQYFGPNQERKSYFTNIRSNISEKIKANLKLEVTYENSSGKPYREIIPLHFNEFDGHGQVETPSLYVISQSLKKIEETLRHISTGFRRLQVDAYSETDRERETQERAEQLANLKASRSSNATSQSSQK